MQFLRFDSLQSIPGLRHAITTRGGNCAGPYDDLNLSYHVGDDAARVTENRKKIAAELGYEAAHLVAAQQVHGSNSHVVTQADKGRGAFDWDSALPDCDALVVQAPRVPVLIQVADCAPVLLVDSKNHVLAVVHAGWRGAVARIASQALAKMQNEYGTQIKDVLVGIGPCLDAAAFEIGEDVFETAKDLGEGVALYDEQYVPSHINQPGPYSLDLRRGIQNDLRDAGVLKNNIQTMEHCTKHHNALFFSHRGQKGTAGRFGLIAWWAS